MKFYKHNLQFIIRDGKQVLQYYNDSNYPTCYWEDIPVYEERFSNSQMGKSGQIICSTHNWVDPRIAEELPNRPTVCSKCCPDPNLKPKEFWVRNDYKVKDGCPYRYHAFVNPIENGIHVTEIPKGHKLVSRDDLWQWFDKVCSLGSPKNTFESLSRHLGFIDDYIPKSRFDE